MQKSTIIIGMIFSIFIFFSGCNVNGQHISSTSTATNYTETCTKILTSFTPTIDETFTPRPTLTPTFTAFPPTLTPFPTLVKIKCENLVENKPEKFYQILLLSDWNSEAANYGWEEDRHYATINEKYNGIMILESGKDNKILFITEPYSIPEGIACPDFIYIKMILFDYGELQGVYQIKTTYGSLINLYIKGRESIISLFLSPSDNDLFIPYESHTNVFSVPLYINKKIDIRGDVKWINWEDPNWCADLYTPRELSYHSYIRLMNGSFVSYLDETNNCPTYQIENVTQQWINTFGDSLPD